MTPEIAGVLYLVGAIIGIGLAVIGLFTRKRLWVVLGVIALIITAAFAIYEQANGPAPDLKRQIGSSSSYSVVALDMSATFDMGLFHQAQPMQRTTKGTLQDVPPIVWLLGGAAITALIGALIYAAVELPGIFRERRRRRL